ncbi:hypothetical protein IV38_GL001969 [Lactobacillus selangorensis]|uniref:Prophage protein n=2 Tax=Lactobacillus selangorensis TaxID=81857 RepID=A0A0R2FRM9_9LACO|nr:hypothetical protein [Lactobacillus selangorensis]KRN27754.1 hypothetical protein IV38_GL001969 [Lactobacillus selangorensis]
MISKIKLHPNHTALGVGLIAIGLWLVANDRFFIWPPYAVDLANDDVWGALVMTVGAALLVWVLDDGRSIRWNRYLLIASAGIMAFLTVYQFMIWAVTGMYHSWISNAIITAFVLIMAQRSDTRHDD